MNDEILRLLEEIKERQIRIEKLLQNNDKVQEIDTVKADDTIQVIRFKLAKVVREETSEVSYNTWIKEPIKTLNIIDNVAILECNNTFTQEILEKRYMDLLVNGFKCINVEIKEIKTVVENKR